MKRVLVLGAGGSIGSELVRQLSASHKVYCVDIDETNVFDLAEEMQLKGRWVHARVGSICDKETVEDVFSDFRPQVVINAAARKHVKPMEQTPMEAINVNVIGNENVLQACKRWKVGKFVYVSTDKAVNAESIMGATKLLGERMTRNAGYIAVRFGNVMGSRGSVLPFWESQINKGDPITITDERCERYMMTIPEACELVIKAIDVGKPGEVICLDMGKPVRIQRLAEEIVGQLKGDVKIKKIGLRPGETLSERLMTAEEEARAVKKGKFYVIS